MKQSDRLDGYSLIEALVVLAIVALSSGAAFGVLRQSQPSSVPSQLALMTETVHQHRARAIRANEKIEGTVQAVFSGSICSDGSIIFFPDGSVLSDNICVLDNGTEVIYEVSPLSGTLRLAS